MKYIEKSRSAERILTRECKSMINPKRGKIYVSFKLIEFHQQCTLQHIITKYNVCMM